MKYWQSLKKVKYKLAHNIIILYICALKQTIKMKQIKPTQAELSEIISQIQILTLDFEDYSNKTSDEIMIDTTTDVCLFLYFDIEHPEIVDTSDLDYSTGTGCSSEKTSEGNFFLNRIKPYHESFGFVTFDDHSMAKIETEIKKTKIFANKNSSKDQLSEVFNNFNNIFSHE